MTLAWRSWQLLALIHGLGIFITVEDVGKNRWTLVFEEVCVTWEEHSFISFFILYSMESLSEKGRKEILGLL